MDVTKVGYIEISETENLPGIPTTVFVFLYEYTFGYEGKRSVVLCWLQCGCRLIQLWMTLRQPECYLSS